MGSSLCINDFIYMESKSVGIFHWWPSPPLNLYETYSRPLTSDSPQEQASKMTPSDSCLLVAMCSLLPQWIGVTDASNRILWKWQNVTSKTRSSKSLPSHLFLLDYLLWGKPASMSWGHPKRSMWQRIEFSCQKPGEQDNLEVDSPLPAKPSDDRSYSQHFHCNFMKDPEPEKPSYAAPRFLTLRKCVRWYIVVV